MITRMHTTTSLRDTDSLVFDSIRVMCLSCIELLSLHTCGPEMLFAYQMLLMCWYDHL